MAPNINQSVNRCSFEINSSASNQHLDRRFNNISSTEQMFPYFQKIWPKFKCTFISLLFTFAALIMFAFEQELS